MSECSGNSSNRHDPSTACWQQQMQLREQIRIDVRDRCACSADHVRSGLSRGHCLVLVVSREVFPWAGLMCKSFVIVKQKTCSRRGFFRGTLWVPKFTWRNGQRWRPNRSRANESAESDILTGSTIRFRMSIPVAPAPPPMVRGPQSAHPMAREPELRICRCHVPFRPGWARPHPSVRRSCRRPPAKGRKRPRVLPP